MGEHQCRKHNDLLAMNAYQMGNSVRFPSPISLQETKVFEENKTLFTRPEIGALMLRVKDLAQPRTELLRVEFVSEVVSNSGELRSFRLKIKTANNFAQTYPIDFG